MTLFQHSLDLLTVEIYLNVVVVLWLENGYVNKEVMKKQPQLDCLNVDVKMSRPANHQIKGYEVSTSSDCK